MRLVKSLEFLAIARLEPFTDHWTAQKRAEWKRCCSVERITRHSKFVAVHAARAM